jgi:hypothetical protein
LARPGGSAAVDPVDFDLGVAGRLQRLALAGVGDLDESQRAVVGGQAFERRGDRRQRGLVAGQQRVVGAGIPDEVQARAGDADRVARADRAAPARGPRAVAVQDDVDHDARRVGVVAADRVVAGVLLGRAGRETPAVERKDRLGRAAGGPDQREDLAGLLVGEARDGVAAQRDPGHPRRDPLHVRDGRDPRPQREGTGVGGGDGGHLLGLPIRRFAGP